MRDAERAAQTAAAKSRDFWRKMQEDMEAPSEWVLWGQKYVETPIKITGGAWKHCQAAYKTREREGGWAGMLILRAGQPYPHN